MNKEKMDQYLAFCLKNGFDILSPDSPQRKAVLDDSYSVLPAGAGSGKTTVLTYRFLRLLMDDEKERIHSDEILTITFTKAATANMRAKIYLILKKAQSEGLIEEEELTRFSSAEISTTDSFCQKIVRSDSTRYGISTSFTIEDDKDYEAFIKRTLKKVIDEKMDEKEVRNLTSLLSFDTLLEAYAEFAKNYVNIALPFSSDTEEVYRQMKDETILIVRSEMKGRKEDLVALTKDFISLFSSAKSIRQDTDHASYIMHFLLDGKEIPAESKFSLKRTVKEDPSKNGEFTAKRKAIQDKWKDYLEKTEYLDEEKYSLLLGYCSILTAMQERILLHKREEGALTFHDVMLLAIDILKTSTSIRKYYNTKYRKIMVDEFQDNNEENKRLLYLLAAKDEYRETERYPGVDDIDIDKIFMVGDEKQSIYRFRGADVSVFKNISRDFGTERVLPLSQNFRSENTLIEKINRIFNGRIMPLSSADEFEAEYTPLVSRNDRVKSSVSFRYMNVKNIPDDTDTSLLATNALSEGYEVARIIHDEILGNEREKYLVYDRKSGKLRCPVYSDISILLRNGSNQSAFEKALRHFSIPFNVSDNKSLTMDAVMNDFYSILQYSVYGDDDTLTLASLLRSPFINMSDSDIEYVLKNVRENEEKEKNLSEDGKDRLVILSSLMQELRKKERKESLASLIHYLWFDCGYRYSIETDERNESFSEHYDYLFSIAADFDSSSKSLVDLLDRIRPSLGKTSDFKDTSVQREEKEGVTIQTIHKSKGLEYPIVFVSDMGVKPRAETFPVTTLPVSGLPLYKFFLSGDGELKNPVSDLKGVENSRIENAETKRILYVAATRSEHHLIFTSVFGKMSTDKDGNITGTKEDRKNNLLQYLVEGMNFDFENGSDIIETREFKPVFRTIFKEKGRRGRTEKNAVGKWYSDPLSGEKKAGRTKIGVTSLIGEEDVKTDAVTLLPEIKADRILLSALYAENLTQDEINEKKEKRITDFGTLVHLLLENAIKNEEADTSSFFRDEKERDEIILSAMELRDTFLSSPFFRSLEGYTLYPEKDFQMRDGSNIVQGIIDLLCVSKDKIIIVDYKSDSIKAPQRHKAQLDYYRKAVSSIYPERVVESYIFYLRSGEAVPL